MARNLHRRIAKRREEEKETERERQGKKRKSRNQKRKETPCPCRPEAGSQHLPLYPLGIHELSSVLTPVCD